MEFLVEEPSMEATLINLVPKILTRPIFFKVKSFQGKQDLLQQLPRRLKAYRNFFQQEIRLIVLIDRDSSDCHKLKAQLEAAALAAGFATRQTARGQTYQILNRILVEELEAWFLGDMEAIAKAYPKISPQLAQKAKYREPDAISGAYETLAQLFKSQGYYQNGRPPKIEVAQAISPHMQPDRNRSKSFQVFRDGLREMAAHIEK